MISQIEKCNREIGKLKDELRKAATPEECRKIMASIKHLENERISIARWRG